MAKKMKKTNLLKTLGIAAVLIPLVGGFAKVTAEERSRDFYESRIERISEIEVTLNTSTKSVNPNNEEPYSYEKIGNGFVVGNYVFTADHVTSRYSVKQRSPFGTYYMELDRIEEKTFIDDLQIFPVIEDRQKDIAIFDLSKTPELCEVYCNDLTLENLATSEDLYTGMEVYWMASPNLRGNFYRSSHISSIREVKGFTDEESELLTNFLDNSFSINNSFRNGTSGKPIWSGDKIIGVAHYILDVLGYAKVMDEYIKVIKKYENSIK